MKEKKFVLGLTPGGFSKRRCQNYVLLGTSIFCQLIPLAPTAKPTCPRGMEV